MTEQSIWDQAWPAGLQGKRCSKEAAGEEAEHEGMIMENEDACWEALPGAFCLIRADGSERIVRYNRLLLDLYQCQTDEEFQQLTGGFFRGMMLSSAYRPLSEQVAGGRQEPQAVRYLSFEICTAATHIHRVDAYVRRIEWGKLSFWSLCLVDAGR